MPGRVRVRGVPRSFTFDPRLDAYASRRLTASAIDDEKVRRAREQFEQGRITYTAKTQPRDSRGKFRKVLARLKVDLGKKQLQQIVNEIRMAEAADEVGDYTKSGEAARNVIQMVDDIDEGTLDPESIKNVRNGARELGEVLAYLPLPQGVNAAKVRFSDLPPSTQKLIKDMMERVKSKIGSEDATLANSNLRSFISGVRTMSSDEILSELNKLLRLLT